MQGGPCFSSNEIEQWQSQEGFPVSISIGIVFYTDWTRNFARICQYNTVMSRLGFKTYYPNVGSVSGKLKAIYQALSRRAEKSTADTLLRQVVTKSQGVNLKL